MCLRSICFSRHTYLSYSFAVLFTEEILKSQSVLRIEQGRKELVRTKLIHL